MHLHSVWPFLPIHGESYPWQIMNSPPIFTQLNPATLCLLSSWMCDCLGTQLPVVLVYSVGSFQLSLPSVHVGTDELQPCSSSHGSFKSKTCKCKSHEHIYFILLQRYMHQNGSSLQILEMSHHCFMISPENTFQHCTSCGINLFHHFIIMYVWFALMHYCFHGAGPSCSYNTGR